MIKKKFPRKLTYILKHSVFCENDQRLTGSINSKVKHKPWWLTTHNFFLVSWGNFAAARRIMSVFGGRLYVWSSSTKNIIIIRTAWPAILQCAHAFCMNHRTFLRNWRYFIASACLCKLFFIFKNGIIVEWKNIIITSELFKILVLAYTALFTTLLFCFLSWHKSFIRIQLPAPLPTFLYLLICLLPPLQHYSYNLDSALTSLKYSSFFNFASVIIASPFGPHNFEITLAFIGRILHAYFDQCREKSSLIPDAVTLLYFRI